METPLLFNREQHYLVHDKEHNEGRERGLQKRDLQKKCNFIFLLEPVTSIISIKTLYCLFYATSKYSIVEEEKIPARAPTKHMILI